jgi:hypothetical protein
MTSEYIPFMRTDFAGRRIAGEMRAALVTAHPGHELCLYGWLKRARPCVFIFTDGSGSTGEPRLELTTKLLARTGARCRRGDGQGV